MQVRSHDSFSHFFGLIINGCKYKKVDIYKSLTVICVLNFLVNLEAADSYSALVIITRHQISELLYVFDVSPNKTVERAKIYAEFHKSNSEKKNPCLSICDFQKFETVTIPN